MNGQVTLKKIAEVCGLSVPTVSQIINNRPNNYSSEKTKALVLNTARELGYRKNFVYSLMHGEKTHTVALMVHMHRGMHEEYLRDLIIRIARLLEERNYTCYVAALGQEGEENIRKIREYLSRGVGCFICLNNPVGYERIAALVEKSGALLTGISDSCRRYVMIDCQQPFKDLIAYVRSRVGENYRFLTLKDSFQSLRWAVFSDLYPELDQAALQKRYFRFLEPFEELPELFQEQAFTAGFQTAQKILREEPAVKALVCVNDAFAVGAAAGVRKSGRIVGKDIIITGFNNDSALRYHPDPVSTIDLNWDKHVEVLVDHALSKKNCQLKFQGRLIIRDSDS